MRRRDLFTFVAAALGSSMAAQAQPKTRGPCRLGYLGSGSAVPFLLDTLRQGLHELGWIEGQNLIIDYRFAEGQDERLPVLAAELVRVPVDVIAASPTAAALAAKGATGTIPIVGIGFDNPVERGLVASLARPDGNVTGLSYSVGPEIFGKDLELLKELIPDVRQIAVLSNSASPNHAAMLSNVETAARSLGVQTLLLDARGPDAFEAAFAGIPKERVGALFVFGDPMFGVHRARLAEFAIQNRLPSMYTNRLHVDAGGLICYGPSFSDLWRRAATYVDKILSGAKPADLPVEQPTKFELVINLKTAKALGIAVPQSILARADEVIE